ncbi:hypothetical protein C9J12_22680 [Photobacterium frigidiphilum]|uniref:Uncharacterized protein n=1 Tax=Photobacterium frigidiphilum TaxID=264736 RepID=A0A2T3J9C6_9GAMM|nr:virulence factor TspB C-terminal domain-related protein [Photobacterium frigidiphilum]PSU45375.1 hypothetical protein C9J12_22680 [Photobacterium frigidiphilum]
MRNLKRFVLLLFILFAPNSFAAFISVSSGGQPCEGTYKDVGAFSSCYVGADTVPWKPGEYVVKSISASGGFAHVVMVSGYRKSFPYGSPAGCPDGEGLNSDGKCEELKYCDTSSGRNALSSAISSCVDNPSVGYENTHTYQCNNDARAILGGCNSVPINKPCTGDACGTGGDTGGGDTGGGDTGGGDTGGGDTGGGDTGGGGTGGGDTGGGDTGGGDTGGGDTGGGDTGGGDTGGGDTGGGDTGTETPIDLSGLTNAIKKLGIDNKKGFSDFDRSQKVVADKLADLDASFGVGNAALDKSNDLLNDISSLTSELSADSKFSKEDLDAIRQNTMGQLDKAFAQFDEAKKQTNQMAATNNNIDETNAELKKILSAIKNNNNNAEFKAIVDKLNAINESLNAGDEDEKLDTINETLMANEDKRNNHMSDLMAQLAATDAANRENAKKLIDLSKFNHDGTLKDLENISDGIGDLVTEAGIGFCEKNPDHESCVEKTVTSACEQSFECDGDALICMLLELEHTDRCEEIKTDSLISGIDGIIGSGGVDQLIGETVDFSSVDNKYLNGAGVTLVAECPAPSKFNVLGESLSFSYQPLCDLASLLRPFVIAMSWVMAAVTVGRGISTL